MPHLFRERKISIHTLFLQQETKGLNCLFVCRLYYGV